MKHRKGRTRFRMITREPIIRPAPKNALAERGKYILGVVEGIGHAGMICAGAFSQMRYALTRRSRTEIVRQLYVCAVKSLPVVTVVAFFIGKWLLYIAGKQSVRIF